MSAHGNVSSASACFTPSFSLTLFSGLHKSSFTESFTFQRLPRLPRLKACLPLWNASVPRPPFPTNIPDRTTPSTGA